MLQAFLQSGGGTAARSAHRPFQSAAPFGTVARQGLLQNTMQGAQAGSGTLLEQFREDNPRFDQSLSAYQGSQELAQSVGIEDDGSAPMKLVEGALNVLDIPFQGVRGAVERTTGIDVDDIGLFRPQDSDNLVQRGARATGGFLTRVAFDPLTYVGGAGVLRRGGARMIEGGARKAFEEAAETGGEQFIRRWANRHQGSAIDRQITSRARATGDDRIIEQARQAVQARRESTPLSQVEQAREAFTERMAESWLTGRSRGVHRFLHDELDGVVGSEAAERLFRDLPRQFQGGLAVHVPFTSEPIAQVGRAGAITNWNPQLDAAAMAITQARQKIRGSRFGRATMDKLGKHGELYGAMMTDVWRSYDDTARTGYATYRAVRELFDGVERFGKHLDQAGGRHLARGKAVLDAAPDEETGINALRKFFYNPNATVGNSELEQRAAIVAREWHEALAERHTDLVRRGLVDENQYIPGYVPRIMTKEEAAEQAGRRLNVARGTRGAEPARSGHTGSRTAYVRDIENLPDGTVDFTWMDPSEIAEAAGRQVYLDNPIEIMGRYLSTTNSMMTRQDVLVGMRQLGVTLPGVSETRLIPSVQAADGVRAGRDMSRAATAARQQAADQAAEAAEAATRAGRGDAAALRETAGVREQQLNQALRDDDVIREASDAIMDRIRDGGAFTADMNEFMTKYFSALGRTRDRVAIDDVLDEQGVRALDALRDQFRTENRFGDLTRNIIQDGSDAGIGLQRFGTELPAGRVPEMWELMHGPQMVRQIADRYVAATNPGNTRELAKQIDAWYRPFFALFKTTSTVGRGYGYDARNIIGGTWNAYLAGVNAADWSLSGRLTAATNRIAKEMETEIARGVRTMREIEELAEQKLRRAVGHIEVEPGLSLYDVHVSLRDRQLFTSTRLDENLMAQSLTRNPQGSNPRDLREFIRGRSARLSSQVAAGEPEHIATRAANMVLDGPGVRHWFRHKTSVAQLSEEYLRTASYLRGARHAHRRGYRLAEEGGDFAEQYVNFTQFDYSDLDRGGPTGAGGFEGRVLAGIAFPFWRWSRNNVPLQFAALMTEPGKVQRLTRLHTALEETFGLNDEDAEIMNELLPEWVDNRMGFVTRYRDPLSGNPITLGIESPLMDINALFEMPNTLNPLTGFGMINNRELVNNMNPLGSVVYESVTGTNTFTGGAMPDTIEAPAPLSLLPHQTPGLGRNQEGNITMDPRVYYGARNLFTPLATVENLAGLSPRAQERMATSWLSQGAALPVTTFTPSQAGAELASRGQRLRSQTQAQAGALQVDLGEIRDLRRAGVPPEMIREMIARGQLEYVPEEE